MVILMNGNRTILFVTISVLNIKVLFSLIITIVIPLRPMLCFCPFHHQYHYLYVSSLEPWMPLFLYSKISHLTEDTILL